MKKYIIKNKKNIWMIIIILIIILASIFIYLNKINKNKNVININTTNKDESSILLISGNGNEPGWSIKITGLPSKRNTVKSDIILDYGDTIWTGNLGRTSQENYNDEFQYRGDINQIKDNKILSENKNIIVFFKKENCHDDADRVHEYNVELNFNSEKTYKGCADILN